MQTETQKLPFEGSKNGEKTLVVASYYDGVTFTNESGAVYDHVKVLNIAPYPSSFDLQLLAHVDSEDETNKSSSYARALLKTGLELNLCKFQGHRYKRWTSLAN